jgi:hypothetical protein
MDHRLSALADQRPGDQKFIYVPYTGQTNDAGMLSWNREADCIRRA